MSRQDRYIPEGMDAADELTPRAVAALADALRGRGRPARSVEQVVARVEPLAEVARRWLDPADPIRREALERLGAVSPFPRAMWADALELMFGPITVDTLGRFIRDELADCFASGRSRPACAAEPPSPKQPLRLRRPRARCGGRRPGGLPHFPSLIGQVLAGNVPAPAVQTVFCGLLAGCGQLVKTAAEDRLFPVLLARSVAAVSGDMGGALAVVHWPGQSDEHNIALAGAVEAIVAFGRADSIDNWRRLAGQSAAGTVLIEHGPRTSLELIELPGDESAASELADAVARDVAMYDQQGCLSPQQVYLAERTIPAGEAGPSAASEPCLGFVRQLGRALSERAACWPIPPHRELGRKLAIRRAREGHRARRLVDPARGPWLPAELCGPEDRFGWTLLGTAGASPQVGPAGRTVLLTRVASLEQAVDALAPLAPMIQGVGLYAGPGPGRLARRLTDELAIPYVCAPGRLQRPPFGWRNDGVPPLRGLLLT